MAIFRRCNNCHKLFQGAECPECSKTFANNRSKKRQANNEALKLYGSRRWRKCRENIRIKYGDYDIWLLGIGIWRKCDKPYIHHIIERDENPDLIYREDNLITVSFSSHEEIHQAYKTDRAEALKRIQRGIEAYREMFNND